MQSYLRILKFATEIIIKGNQDTIITNLFAAIEFSSSQNFNIKKTITLSNIITIMQNLIERGLLDVLLRDKIINSLIDSDRFDHDLKKFITKKCIRNSQIRKIYRYSMGIT